MRLKGCNVLVSFLVLANKELEKDNVKRSLLGSLLKKCQTVAI